MNSLLNYFLTSNYLSVNVVDLNLYKSDSQQYLRLKLSVHSNLSNVPNFSIRKSSPTNVQGVLCVFDRSQKTFQSFGNRRRGWRKILQVIVFVLGHFLNHWRPSSLKTIKKIKDFLNLVKLTFTNKCNRLF